MALITRTLQIYLVYDGFLLVCLFVCFCSLIQVFMYEMRSNEFSSIIRYSKNVNKHTHLYTYISMYLLHNPHCINKMRKNSEIRIALVCLVKF